MLFQQGLSLWGDLLLNQKMPEYKGLFRLWGSNLSQFLKMQSKGVVLELYEAPIYKREKAAFSTFVSLPEASFPALDGEEVDSPSKASSFWPSGWTSSTLLTGALFVSSGPPHSTTEQGWRCARGRPCSIPKCMFMSILTLSTNWGGGVKMHPGVDLVASQTVLVVRLPHLTSKDGWRCTRVGPGSIPNWCPVLYHQDLYLISPDATWGVTE